MNELIIKTESDVKATSATSWDESDELDASFIKMAYGLVFMAILLQTLQAMTSL
jgi:hypothetical protein